MTILDRQMEEVRVHFSEASCHANPDGSAIITVPALPLPPGWNGASTTVRFVAPVGYPMAKPDCFWTSPDLRLAAGGTPCNTGPNPLPNGPSPLLWFSWHAGAWDPNRDSLLTFLRVIERRFAALQ